MIKNAHEIFVKTFDSPLNMECSQYQKCLGDENESEPDTRELALNRQGLSKLPTNYILDNIVSINLEENVFCELPQEIFFLRSLKSLNVAKNKMKLFANEVGNLSNLEYLNCSENQLETLPSSLSMISKLLVLNASRNNIVSIPDELKNLKRLETVDLSYNKLREVPTALVIGSKCITYLDLSHNSLKDFSKEPKCSASLKSFKVNDNCMVELPVWMRCLHCVEELCLGNNPFTCAPHHPLDNMMPLASLTMTKLSINSCSLKNLPISLTNMKNLTYLDAGNHLSYLTVDRKLLNSLWDISPALNLSYLKELRLPHAGLPVLPDEFWKRLNNLEVLDLEDNAVVWLPDGLSSHIHLTVLILSCNRLALLPNEIGAVKSLRELRLDRNKLNELPETIGNLENLIYLDLYDNEISEFPTSIGRLHKLKSLDLELNNIVIDESTIKVFKDFPSGYELMRKNLRSRFLPQNDRLIGSKAPPACNIPNVESDRESDSLSWNSDYQPEIQESMKNIAIVEEDDWDKTDGSDDFFDPEYSKALKNSVGRSQWHWARDNGRWVPPVGSDVFCPADIHPDLIPRSSKKEGPETSDGQFDDVDD
ncbi:leucine-rich repeat protein lrrA-like [Hetaerina americana]|uniref:leucine-rich repeat protein lrrA-like n=1 Tax=Hetaerina americana TaxID=62018 RepID=UPI003A7F156B